MGGLLSCYGTVPKRGNQFSANNRATILLQTSVVFQGNGTMIYSASPVD
jgi:hypothetical protein